MLLMLLACLATACSLAEGDVEPPAARKRPANRLARETSPYLLAHAHNPVDWYPWGPEALEKARKEDKPIFLSIGYSSCHWCHVMEKKVFSDPEIARLMNEHFINIKVDREERPDLDEIYMTGLSVYFELIRSPQGGGWPLSMFLTPDGRPLGGGTYFPPEDQDGQMGFPTLLGNLVQAWGDAEKRKQLETNADILARAVRASLRPKPMLREQPLDRELLAPVAKSLRASYDPEFGGFGFNPRNPRRPKFPVPVKLAYLQHLAVRHGNEEAGQMLYHTLDAMAAGGIYDQVGGGFHRYSTDRAWRVPHFEKMLYDNAQLIDLYAEAYRATRNRHYRAVVEETVEFVLRELADTGGAFFSSLDADSDGVEGRYYVWSSEQLAQVLPEDGLRACRAAFGVAEASEFEHGHVLHVPKPLDDVAAELGLTTMELNRQISRSRGQLLAARQKRVAPARDEKILASWNGLMIRALARAGVILEEPQYVAAAARAAEFVLARMRDDEGRLYRAWCAGRSHVTGYLDDYAHVVEGLISLYAATQQEKWLNAARRLNDLQMSLFWDERGHGCFFTANHHEELLARVKSAYDSVLPSGNSVTVRNLLRLSTMLDQPGYRERARQSLELFCGALAESPTGLTHMALALSEFLETSDAAHPKSSRRARGMGIAPDTDVVMAGAESPSSSAGAARQNKESLVTGKAYLSVDRLPPGATCRLLVELEVAKGWMIHANPAGDEELDVATEVTLQSRHGVELKKLEFPKGTLIDRDEEGPPKSVYRGKVRLYGLLETPQAAAGKAEELVVTVRYQACTDHKCLLPRKLEIPLKCGVARRRQDVNPSNEALFPSPRVQTR